MRLIDADALLAEAMAEGAYGYVDAKQIADAPTIATTQKGQGKTMSDLISRQAAIDAVNIDNLHRGIVDALQNIIMELPSIDAVPVVRCKDCRLRDTFNCGMQFYGYDDDMNLRKSDDWTMDDGYCYWGYRKDV